MTASCTIEETEVLTVDGSIAEVTSASDWEPVCNKKSHSERIGAGGWVKSKNDVGPAGSRQAGRIRGLTSAEGRIEIDTEMGETAEVEVNRKNRENPTWLELNLME